MRATQIRIIIALFVAQMPFATAFAADSASTSIELTAEAKPVCHMPSPTTSSTNNASFDGSKIAIGQLLDDQTAKVKASQIVITYSQVLCNWPATVSIASANGGMTRTSGTDEAVTGSGEFLRRVDYKAKITWGGVSIENFDTAVLQGDKKIVKQTGGANVADMVLVVSTDPGTTPLLNGTYTDTLYVKVGTPY